MKKQIPVFMLLFVVAGSAQTPPNEAAAPKKTLKVLTAHQIDPSRLLPPPPRDGSENQRKELAEVKNIVETRSEQRFAQAKWDNEHEDPTAFAATIGAGFDLNKLPETAKLLALVMNDQSIAASTAKEYFRRKFPVAVETNVADYRQWSCDDDVKKPADRQFRSYPSGHSTMGFSVGIVLADLLPEKAQAILVRAADYAYSREICGDHYHADIEASHALGTSVGIMLLNNPTLQPQIEAARKELRVAHLTGN